VLITCENLARSAVAVVCPLALWLLLRIAGLCRRSRLSHYPGRLVGLYCRGRSLLQAQWLLGGARPIISSLDRLAGHHFDGRTDVVAMMLSTVVFWT
jgi:hypothetical protein